MNVSLILKALANENRLQILQWLREPARHFKSSKCDVEADGVCVGLIEEKISLSQSTVSQYLTQLNQADLITMERKGQWTYCRLNIKTITEFVQILDNILTLRDPI